MNEYKNILTIMNEIEKVNNCKCYLFGRGVRNLLKQKREIDISDFTLVVEKGSISKIYPFERIVFSSVDKYINSKKESFEKIHINSNGEILFKGRQLLNLRKGFLDFDWENYIMCDDNLLYEFLTLIEEGFCFSCMKIASLRFNSNLNKETVIKVLDRFIKTGNLETYKIFEDLGGLTLMAETLGVEQIERYSTSWRVTDGYRCLKGFNFENVNLKEVLVVIILLDLWDSINRYCYNSKVVKNLDKIIKNIYSNILGVVDEKRLNDIYSLVEYCSKMQTLDSLEYEEMLKRFEYMLDENLKKAILVFNKIYYRW